LLESSTGMSGILWLFEDSTLRRMSYLEKETMANNKKSFKYTRVGRLRLPGQKRV